MIELFEKRKSVRSYQHQQLSLEDLDKVKKIIRDSLKMITPFGHHPRFELIDHQVNGSEKIGTYGFVKHAPHFIIGFSKNDVHALIDFGYVFEHIILQCSQLDLGTVWLGGTFKRKQFDEMLELDEFIPCISPIGYPEKQSLREKAIRKIAKSDQRKLFDELFFLDFHQSSIPSNHWAYPILEAVRLAPSASNKQPWRVVVEGDRSHFYLQRTKGYASSLSYDIQMIDIGIALAHFVLMADSRGFQTRCLFLERKDLTEAQYIVSVEVST